MSRKGHLFGVGVGPGDPELITLKALRIVQAADVVAYPAAQHGRSNARICIASELRPSQIEIPMIFPVTTETTKHPGGYEMALSDFYDECAKNIATHLDSGRNVAVLCEGDPFFYGSYMYIHDRLANKYETEVIPGVCSVMAAAARLSTPIVRRDTELTILPGTLSEATLTTRLADGGAYAIMKLGRNFEKVRNAIRNAGLADRARYIERATMTTERIIPLDDVDAATVPYFSLLIVPGSPVTVISTGPSRGSIRVVGLGPGGRLWLSPEATESLASATDIVGYGPYVDRVPVVTGQTRWRSDNRVEIERARHALELAESGRSVCVVSSGDPGIFAMATAVMEAIEGGPIAWRDLDVRIVPGISAMQAAASRVGAPLGHDFCVISLSDRLKPWNVIEQRLEAAVRADFVLALYNPTSSQRQSQFVEACTIISQFREPQTPVILARDLGGPNERVVVSDLARLNSRDIDMRTIVLVGASNTRLIPRAEGIPFVYTPRTYAPNKTLAGTDQGR